MDYEFTPEQNKVISGIVVSAKVASGCIAITAVWKIVNTLKDAKMTGLVVPVFMFVLVGWLWKAAAAFDRVVKTEGADQENLVVAFEELRKIFKGLRAAQIVLMVILGLAIIVALAVAGGTLGAMMHH
jgi:predicted PurR-regulated permease PerM